MITHRSLNSAKYAILTLLISLLFLFMFKAALRTLMKKTTSWETGLSFLILKASPALML
jgi:hypothetical protein